MNIVYATTTTMVTLAGAQYRVQKGSHWPDDDPIVAAQPSIFSTDARYGLEYTREPDGFDAPPVEQATAAPGEQRNTRRPGR